MDFRLVCHFGALLLFIGTTNAKWALVWEDNFNGGNLADKWDFAVGCDGFGNQELQCYTGNRAANVRQENGRLIIQAKKEDYNGKKFTSAKLTSKANWVHGKFEIRARMPKGKHLWPAIWMLPKDNSYGEWPRSGEIDIAEYRGQKPNEIMGTLHLGRNFESRQQRGSGEKRFPSDFSQDFHTYGVDWSPSKIQWILDGNVFHEESLQRNFDPGFYTANGQPFDKKFYLILNLAVGGNFFGNEPFDPSEANGWAKNTLEIDWVKKWEWR